MEKMRLFNTNNVNEMVVKILKNNYSNNHERTFNVLKGFILKYNLEYTVEELYNNLLNSNWEMEVYSELFPKYVYCTKMKINSRLMPINELENTPNLEVEEINNKILRLNNNINNSESSNIYRVRTNKVSENYTYQIALIVTDDIILSLIPRNGGELKFDGCRLLHGKILEKNISVNEAKKLGFTHAVGNLNIKSEQTKKGLIESEQIRKSLTKDIRNIDETTMIGSKLLKLLHDGRIFDKEKINNLEEFKDRLLNSYWSALMKYREDILVLTCDIYGYCDKYTLNEINTNDILVLGSNLNGDTSIFVINKGRKPNQKLHVLVKKNDSNNFTILDLDIGGIFNIESNLLDDKVKVKLINLERVKELGFTSVQDIEIPKNSKEYKYLAKEKRIFDESINMKEITSN